MNIIIKKTSLSNIQQQISKMMSETEAAQRKVVSAINGLDFSVASKQNIRSCLSKLNSSLNKQVSLSGAYKNAFINVTNSIIDSDGKFGSESQSIFDKVKDFIEDSAKSVNDFIIKNKIAKYGGAAGLFLGSPSILCFTSIIILLDRIAAWFNNLFGGSKTTGRNQSGYKSGGSGGGRITENNDASNSANSETTDNPLNNSDSRNQDEQTNHSERSNENNAVSESVKSYSGSSKDLNPGSYSNYTVISGFDEKYVLNQYDYDLQQSDGSNGGCTSTSDAMVGAFKNNQYYNPEDDWPGPGRGGARWTHTKAITDSENWSTSRRYTEMYNQINQGNAVVIRVSGHSMVAIGVQSGCDPNNMSASDVLITNPGTGKISTLQEYLNKSGRKIDNSWPLRIAK